MKHVKDLCTEVFNNDTNISFQGGISVSSIKHNGRYPISVFRSLLFFAFIRNNSYKEAIMREYCGEIRKKQYNRMTELAKYVV